MEKLLKRLEEKRKSSYQIELANKIRGGRAVGNEYVVTQRPIGKTMILARFDSRKEAERWIKEKEKSRVDEMVERKVKMSGLMWLSLANTRRGTISYTVDIGPYIYTLRELDPVEGIWGIQVRGNLGKDGVLLKKRFGWTKRDSAADALRGIMSGEDSPVYDAAKYVASGQASKDVKAERYTTAHKSMWEGIEEGMGSASVSDQAGRGEVASWKRRTDVAAKDVEEKIGAVLRNDLDNFKKVSVALDRKESDKGSNMYMVKANGKVIGWIGFSFPDSGHGDWTFHSKDGSAFFDRFSDRYGAIKRAAQRVAKIRGRM